MKAKYSVLDVFAGILAPVADAIQAETGKRVTVAGWGRVVRSTVGKWFRKLADAVDPQPVATGEMKTEVTPAPVVSVEPQPEPVAVPAGWDVIDTSVPADEPVLLVEVKPEPVRKPAKRSKTKTEPKPAAKKTAASKTKTPKQPAKPKTTHRERIAKERAEAKPSASKPAKRKSATKS